MPFSDPWTVKPTLLATVLVFTALANLPVQAEPAARPISTFNMPPGWQWPPTEAMRQSGERCLAALTEAQVAYERPSRPLGKVVTPVVVPSMEFAGLRVRQMFRRRIPVMDCHMALSLAQHAPLLSELGIRELLVSGFYQNRQARLGGRSIGMLSRHALGLAVDIRALVTEEGKTLWVLRDYDHPLFEQVEATLLERGELRALVSPRNDPAHRNHLHISAKMTIDDSAPDLSIDIAELLLRARPAAGVGVAEADTASAGRL